MNPITALIMKQVRIFPPFSSGKNKRVSKMHLNISSPLQVSDRGDPLPNDTQTHRLPEGSTPLGGPMTSPGLSKNPS